MNAYKITTSKWTRPAQCQLAYTCPITKRAHRIIVDAPAAQLAQAARYAYTPLDAAWIAEIRYTAAQRLRRRRRIAQQRRADRNAWINYELSR